MKTSDLMTEKVISVGPDATIFEAVRLMLEHDVSGLPVVTSDGALGGIVTEGDLLRRVELGTEKRRSRLVSILIDPDFLAADYVQAHARKVADVMTGNVCTVAEDTPIDKVVDLMERRKVKRLPVIRGHKLVGILSRENLMGGLGTALAAAPPTTAEDKQMQRVLEKELHDRRWSRRKPYVVVRDGVIELFWIGAASDGERRAARVAAENVPGVKGVREHFVRRA